MLENRAAQHHEVVDKYANPIVDYAMSTRDYVLRPMASPATGALTITLPAVAEAKGRFYSILALDADTTNTVTIQDMDDSEYWIADITLSAPGHRALLYSDGRCWHPLGGDVGESPGASTDIPSEATSAAPTTVAPTTSQATAAPSTAAPTTLAATTLAPTTAGG